MTTVIDELIVKLGLDPRDFTKGQKEAAAAVSQTEEKVTKSTGRMGKEITSLALKWTSVAFAIAAVKKAVSVIDDVATKTRKLGIDSKNYGIAAAGMRNFENAVEMFGGSAEAARASIAGFNKSIFDLAYNGQMSDGLVMLARLGVEFQEVGGEARDFKAIALDTADAIGKAQEQGMTRANAFQFLQQAGFDQGTANMLLAGRGAVQAGLDDQGQRRQVSDSDIDKATRISQARIGKDQTLENGKIMGMNTVGGIQATVNEFLANPMKTVDKSLTELDGTVTSLTKSFNNYRISTMPKGRAGYESVIQRAASQNGIPAEILAGVLKTESNFDPTAKNKSGATGIAQLMPKYFPNAGQSPDDDIRTAAKYLAELEKQADGNWDVALQMYNAGPTRVRNSMKEGGTPLAQETLDYPGKVLDYATAEPTPGAQSSNSSRTDVQIDSITIQTRATDAEGIAGDMDGAVKRKIMAGHAETGMQ